MPSGWLAVSVSNIPQGCMCNLDVIVRIHACICSIRDLSSLCTEISSLFPPTQLIDPKMTSSTSQVGDHLIGSMCDSPGRWTHKDDYLLSSLLVCHHPAKQLVYECDIRTLASPILADC